MLTQSGITTPAGMGDVEPGKADPSNAGTGDLGNPVLVGLVGRGIQLSRTPRMHEMEGRALGLRYIFKLLDVDRMGQRAPEIGDLLDYAAHFGFSGLNVTYPYKQAAIAHLDELSPAASALGSVNTIVFRDGRRFGHNTDLWGFRESFRHQMGDVKLGEILLVGAGGAGVAVAQGLLELGAARLAIHDLDIDRSETLVARLAAQFGEGRVRRLDDFASAGAFDGVVNATPIGMAGKPGTPFDPDRLEPHMWVADIVYFPLETEFLKKARLAGCRTINGAGMAVHQAVRAFELFTGLKPDTERMKATFAAFDR